MRKNTDRGFSTIMAILITAFLIVMSSGILGIVLEESKNTRLVYNSIATYEGAVGANEYALLKIKNHTEGFQDKIGSIDAESKLLSINPSSPTNKDQELSYEISNYGKNYTGTVNPGDFDIIPLFYDEGQFIQIYSKNPNKGTSNIISTQNIQITSTSKYVWNILGNNSEGDTFGVTGTGGNGMTISNMTAGVIKQANDDTGNMGANTYSITFTGVSIGDFIASHSGNYLTIYNPLSTPIEYNISSTNGFTYPKLKVIGSGKIGNFRQNIEFVEDKNKYFDALKYSLYNK